MAAVGMHYSKLREIKSRRLSKLPKQAGTLTGNFPLSKTLDFLLSNKKRS